MKTLLATMTLAAGLAAVATSPALAQNGTHRQVRDPYTAYATPFGATQWGYGSGYTATPRPSPRRSFDVFDTRGDYIGSDPDPTVRDQLARDPSQGD
jgi:hypothetical protein